MASIILGTIGGSIGGPVGGFVGSTLGGFVDSWLFGSLQPPIKGPRLTELRMPSFDEGSPAPWVQGPRSRVACQVLWMGSASGPNKVEERKSTSGGGKGGGRPKTTTYDYFVSIAIGFARQTCTPSKPVKKLWANGVLIYEADKAAAASSSNVKVIKNTVSKTFSQYCVNKADQEEIIYEHQGSATFFQDAGFKSNANKVVIAGFANGANNGTLAITKIETVGGKSRLVVAKCPHTWKAGGTVWAPTCTDTSSCVPAVNENAGAAVTFTQSMDEWDKGIIEDATQYRGTTAQTADATIVAVEGAGNVSGYRGTGYIVLKNLKITNWGGSIPAFEALVEEATTRTVADALVNIAVRNGGLTSDSFDVTAVPGNLLGVVMMGPKDPKSILQLLMSVYDLECQERAVVDTGVFKNRLVFFPKASADLRAIADEDRGAIANGTGHDGKDLISVEQTDPDLLPGQIQVAFVDPDEDYQQGSRIFRRAAAHTESQTSLSLPMTLTASNALALAKKLMWQYQTNGRLKVHLTLPPTYVDIAEADRITVSDVDGLALRARVSQVDRGANGMLTVEALQEVETVYSEAAGGETKAG